MLLTNKVAVVYGAGGAVGSVVARGFAKEGARVFAAGRRMEPVERVVREIVGEGGAAEAAAVDALDEAAVERHSRRGEKPLEVETENWECISSVIRRVLRLEPERE